jgi:hypothetical protein
MAALNNLNLWLLVFSAIGLSISWRVWVHYNGLQFVGSGQPDYTRRIQVSVALMVVFGIGLAWALSTLIYARMTGVQLVAPPTATAVPLPSPLPTSLMTDTPVGNLPPSEAEGSEGSPPASDGTPQTARIGNTNTFGANMRAEPSLSAEVITSLSDGTRVTLLGTSEKTDGLIWQAVRLEDGRQGWIADLFLFVE